MKLYTEEQVKKAIICTRNEYPLRYVQDIINDLKNVQIPSDEDIWEKIEDSTYSLEYDTGFAQGVKWVIEQIKQQEQWDGNQQLT
jgi:hypothetical protein